MMSKEREGVKEIMRKELIFMVFCFVFKKRGTTGEKTV